MTRTLPLLLVALLAIGGCGRDDAGGSTLVSPAAAADILADGGETLVDVRTPDEFAAGHLAGAVLVDYEAADFRERIAELPRGDDYVIYCRTGRRSAGAAEIMADLGFTDVTEIDGGIEAWLAADLPIQES